jgi:hypothetical protein
MGAYIRHEPHATERGAMFTILEEGYKRYVEWEDYSIAQAEAQVEAQAEEIATAGGSPEYPQAH